MKKLFLLLAIILIISSGVWFLVSPYIALQRFSSYLREGNASEASRYVDYESLKEDLKKDFKALLAKEVAKENYDEGAGFFAVAFGSLFIDAFVEIVVSPEGLTYIIESGRIPMEEDNTQTLSVERRGNAISETKVEEKSQRMETKAGYRGISTFVYSIRDRDSQEGIDLIFERRGFADWKLTGMDFHFKGQ